MSAAFSKSGKGRALFSGVVFSGRSLSKTEGFCYSEERNWSVSEPSEGGARYGRISGMWRTTCSGEHAPGGLGACGDRPSCGGPKPHLGGNLCRRKDPVPRRTLSRVPTPSRRRDRVLHSPPQGLSRGVVCHVGGLSRAGSFGRRVGVWVSRAPGVAFHRMHGGHSGSHGGGHGGGDVSRVLPLGIARSSAPAPRRGGHASPRGGDHARLGSKRSVSRGRFVAFHGGPGGGAGEASRGAGVEGGDSRGGARVDRKGLALPHSPARRRSDHLLARHLYTFTQLLHQSAVLWTGEDTAVLAAQCTSWGYRWSGVLALEIF